MSRPPASSAADLANLGWEVGTGRQGHVLPLKDCGYPLAFSPQGTTLVSGSWDGMVRIWDTGTGQEIRSIDIEKNNAGRKKWETIVDEIGFSADGRAVVTSGQKSIPGRGIGPLAGGKVVLIQLWDPATGDQLLRHQASLPPHAGYTRVAPGGQVLAFEDNARVVLWDVLRNKKRLELSPGNGFHIGQSAFPQTAN
jgi:WD40 repeat protein